MDFSVFITGFGIGLGLIVAIGAQNAFVLRQGLRGSHVLAVCLACAVSDAILIAIGVTSFASIARILPWLDPVMRIAGAAFLIWYAIRSLRSALAPAGGLVADGAEVDTLARTLVTCLALTWLNPHVYLDTVVLLGTISTQFAGSRTVFASGAITASFVFFFTLGYGARWLRPLFARPSAWRVLDAAIALVMTAIAIRLLAGT
jgi:L-lysine exporter family protein LysE/ArgO